MPEPTFGHQPITRDEARAEYLRTLAKLDGVEVPHVLAQPDDPGPFARRHDFRHSPRLIARLVRWMKWRDDRRADA